MIFCNVEQKKPGLFHSLGLLLVRMTSHEFLIFKQTNKVDVGFNSTVLRWIIGA